MAKFWPIVLATAGTMAVTAGVALADVPTFDIGPTCRAASADSQVHRPQGACERDENQARATLQKQWGNFTKADQQRCTTLVQTGGSPSYVELLTCLQTAAEAAKLPKKGLEGPVK